jgi:D-ribose pyranase
MESANPRLFEQIVAMFKTVEVEIVPHAEFKKKTKSAKAIVRTGEFTPYANIILESGVLF